EGYGCTRGCKGNGDCPSDGGALLCDVGSHQCVRCLLDADCPIGEVCHAGSCAQGCTAQHGCPMSLTCCGGACVDVTQDAENCSACGAACDGGWQCCLSTCINPVA